MKQLFKILIGTAIIINCQFSAVNSAFAQFAGPDKKVAREPGNTQRVSIGMPDASSDVCYVWTGPNIADEAFKAVIEVNPQDTLEIYNVKRISKNGVEEDQVKVRVEDTIAIVSVKGKFKCYNVGDKITTEPKQFEIVTDPPGYENLVTVSPAVATNNAGMAVEDGVVVTFTLTKNGHTSTKTTTISVYNSDLVAPLDVIQGSLKTFKFMMENMKIIDDIWENIESISNCVEYLAPASPCGWSSEKPQGEAGWELNISPKLLCCSDNTPAPALQISLGKASYGNTYSCRFPFYGIPYVASADVVFNLSAGFFVGPVTGVISTNRECAQLCIPAGVNLTVNGGVGVSVGGGKLLAADLLLQGSTTGQVQWCPIGSNNTLSVGITFSVVGNVVCVGLIKHNIEYPFATYGASIDLPNFFTSN